MGSCPERERLAVLLEQTGIVGVVRPSSANFLLCRVLKGRAKEIHAALQHQAIFVRYFNAPSVENCLRISVGKPEHTDALIAALKKVVPE
jgi:histidinol-phosphate/aromatic aminotransferase/cobyric acid decarboxylase-like protein